MNNQRRKDIDAAIALTQEAQGKVADAISAVEYIKDEEQEYFDNMPESLQGGDKGQQAESNVSELESAQNELENIDFDSAIGNLENARDG